MGRDYKYFFGQYWFVLNDEAQVFPGSKFFEWVGNGFQSGDWEVRNQIPRVGIDEDDARQTPKSQQQAQGKSFSIVILSFIKTQKLSISKRR